MVDKVHDLAEGLDYGYVLKEAVKQILGRTVDFESFVDSNKVFEIDAKNSETTEKSLRIDMFELKEYYAR